MKKFIILLLITTFALSACTAPESSGELPETSEMAEKIMNEVGFMSPSEKEINDIEFYVDIDTSVIVDATYYICGSGAYPDELLIIKFADDKAALSAVEKVNDRLENQIKTYTSYTPEEMYKLENAVIETRNEYLFFFAMEDNPKVREIIDGILKKEN